MTCKSTNVEARTEIKERPILMHARSIRGILEGRKTQTRRIIKPQPDFARIPDLRFEEAVRGADGKRTWISTDGMAVFNDYGPAYGFTGDRLWVRETWGGDDLCGYAYRADHPDWLRFQGDGDQPDSAWKPSIHMPRKASRLTLEITNIRVERVQDISDKDVMAEGCPYVVSSEAFEKLWDDTNGKGAWDRNDWVWVVEFQKR